MDRSIFTLGGAAWINLVNTVNRYNKQRNDFLTDPALASQWLEANQLMPSSAFPLVPSMLQALTAELASLRELCQQIISDLQPAGGDGRLSEQVVAALRLRTERLSISASLIEEEGRISIAYEGQSMTDRVMHRILHSVTDTLHKVSADRIRKCEHEECILHFVDTSKSGKRRWCSMELCGNRHKAAEFYAKKKQKHV